MGSVHSYEAGATVATAHVPRILVVEDDAEFADLMCWELETSGYVVDMVSSIYEARRNIRQGGAPDLIVSDVRLGDGSGVMLLFPERGTANRPSVLILSDSITQRLRHLLDRTGTAVLEKSFSSKRLHAIVLNVLRRNAGARRHWR